MRDSKLEAENIAKAGVLIMRLSDTEVVRGGVTAHYWSNEWAEVSAQFKDELHLTFDIASKGGGRTGIRVEMGFKDIKKLSWV